jgi:alpha-L-fucosidase 2
MSTGISKVNYMAGETEIMQESFISAVDDVLCIRLASTGKEKLNCTVGLQRFKDADVIVLPGNRLNIDGQVIDVEAPNAYDDNAGGSGPGGKHMRFSGRLTIKTTKGTIKSTGNDLRIESAKEVILLFTAATDYNLALMNFDSAINPGEKADEILNKADEKSWVQLKEAHTKEHSQMFNRVSFDLGSSADDTLPTDTRLEAFQKGAEDNALVVQAFQFGRYLLMNSSRTPAVLPANLQGKWSEEKWAPWEADYHLNVNLQMNYWPSDVTNLSETNIPLINWFELLTEKSKPFAKEMYNANGWFSALAANPFGRVTPSASTPESQFINGVLDPLAGAWMVMNLWDHYEYTQDQNFLKETLYPLLKGGSEFILDVLIPDSAGKLQFVPSTSPENSYVDPAAGRLLRITSTSAYHLSVIKAIFEATLEASEILNIRDSVCDRIKIAENQLPGFPVSDDGYLMEWQTKMKESEPGHRHLSHLLAVHPFAIITEKTPELFIAARKSLDWRKDNGQGKGGGWSSAHASLMYAWFHDGESAFKGIKTILNSFDKTLLNVHKIFQIDANFGFTSCIAEMLIQSHLKDENGNFILQLLPAIPSEWPAGSVKGLCTRGGFVVDMDWQDGQLKSVLIYSPKGGTCKLQYQGKETELNLNAGERRRLTEL